jgi:hypothetical protein
MHGLGDGLAKARRQSGESSSARGTHLRYGRAMGAWGPGSFENDSAMDWLSDLGAGEVEIVRETLARAADAEDDDYVDVDDASAALAAAEMVAAALGKGDERLNDEAVDGVAGYRKLIEAPDLGLARRAVERVLASSEVQQLWDEGGTENEWRTHVRELLRRLS